MKETIFTKFSNKHKIIIRYQNENGNNNHKHKNQEKLFNNCDLMCNIFQHLRFKDLIKCDLICSYWLYHCWNINCIIYDPFDLRIFAKHDKTRI